jgi:hypothetical protein
MVNALWFVQRRVRVLREAKITEVFRNEFRSGHLAHIMRRRDVRGDLLHHAVTKKTIFRGKVARERISRENHQNTISDVQFIMAAINQ